MVAGRAGGAGEDLSLTRTSSPPDPPKSIHLNPFHYTATKSSFTPLEITTGQDKIYGHTAHLYTRLLYTQSKLIHNVYNAYTKLLLHVVHIIRQKGLKGQYRKTVVRRGFSESIRKAFERCVDYEYLKL